MDRVKTQSGTYLTIKQNVCFIELLLYFIFILLEVRGTIFNELDDDKLNDRIDFLEFEEKFKIGINIGGMTSNSNSEIDGLNSYPSKRFKKPDNITLLEHTRLRNIGE